MPTQRRLWLILFLTLCVWFGNLEYRKLVRPDEGRYAEIPREMVASGDWLTPRLNGIKYFEKPPLQYWATAAAFTMFGEHAWTTRLWPALTGLLGLFAVFYGGSRLFGAAAGWYAALVLGSSFIYVVIAHVNTLDMGVTFFLSLGLIGLLLAQRPEATNSENRNGMLMAWAALALAMLSKGLIGIVLPAAVLVLYSLFNRDFHIWKRLHLIKGMLLFLVISAPWFIAVSIANPEFPYFFFIHEHFARYATTVHNRDQPWFYFLPMLFVGIMPWLVTMGDALLRAWGSPTRPAAFQPRRFLLIWVVFIFIFFSFSDSKLPSYILPIFPALALLIGQRLTTLSGRALAWHIAPMALLALVGLLLAPRIVDFASDETPGVLFENYVPWLLAAAFIMLAGCSYALFSSWRGRVQPAILALGLSCLLTTQLALSGHESFAPSTSAYGLSQKIQPYLKPDIPFYSVGIYEQTLPFYIKRSVTLVAFQDELAFGLKQEPSLWLPEIADFARAWRAAPDALAIMNPDMYEQLRQSGLPMQEIARDTRRVVVKTLS